MSETRKLAAILVADVVGYSRLAGTDEDRILARLRTLRSDLIDPILAVHHGRVVKRTGDGAIIEFRSVVDAVRCAIEVQSGLAERNAGLPPAKRIEYRVGIHLGEVVEEADGDLMGDGVNIAARLEGVAKPGTICLSEDAYRQVKQRLDLKVSDLGATQLKNIAEPIHVYSLEVGQPTEARPASAAPPGKPGPPRLSLVVLPFTNIGGDPEQEHFVDGVTESLTTDLSRMRGAFVIGRNTAFTFKRKAVDLKQIGRELNVRYVLEGSVQRGSNRMRVNVQLIDAESGNHLWAERFDKPLADLFDTQDEIVGRLANQLGTELIAAEARRAAQAPNPDSMDLYFQGMAWFNKGRALENMIQARAFFERALALDPNNVDALLGQAMVDVVLGGGYLTDHRAEHLAAAEATLNKVLAQTPNNASAHRYLGSVKASTNRAAQAITEFEHALALDPNFAAAHAGIGVAKLYTGRAEETESHMNEALRLSPRDSAAFGWMAVVGGVKVHLGADAEAVAWLRRAINVDTNVPFGYFFLAAALANLGKQDEALEAAQRGLALDPSFTVRRFRALAESDTAARAPDRRHAQGGRAGELEELSLGHRPDLHRHRFGHVDFH
jgi:TolB-like protein/class 3 adenylate cyclase/Tfp pilus assembly protein PilF